MAGSYPDFPSRKIPYEADGTVVYYATNTDMPFSKVASLVDTTDATTLNKVDGTTLGWSGKSPTFGFLFPEKRDLYATFGHYSTTNSGVYQIYTSVDTTNMYDGTWVQETDQTTGGSTFANWRTNTRSATYSGINSIGLRGYRTYYGTPDTVWVYNIHLYGMIASGETPDRLLWIDEATGLEFGDTSAPVTMDWGNKALDTTNIWQFRLKNNSATLSATNTTISISDADRGSSAWYEYSTNGSTYSVPLNIGTIAAGSTSVLLYARQVIPAGAESGNHLALQQVTRTWV